jgi:hypothetical protein
MRLNPLLSIVVQVIVIHKQHISLVKVKASDFNIFRNTHSCGDQDWSFNSERLLKAVSREFHIRNDFIAKLLHEVFLRVVSFVILLESLFDILPIFGN